ncbi:MAG: class I SAM-dependent methyltransferase [Deltaproteobacteria bacterium]|nr:class I SAM-dependent methyltransferase [Deltaproteobacteria bacterium]
MAEKKAYTQAASTGKYDKTTGLLGKYDNVRRLWEDQVTGIFLRPAFNDLVEYKSKRLERLRILDIGCGSGDGFDLLMGVKMQDPGHYDFITAAITNENLKEYVGIDINEDLLKQAEEYYGHNPKTRFVKDDLSHGLPKSIKDMDHFDIYSTSFGTLSHFHDDQNVNLIADLCRHAPERAIFIGDWLGRYSYEWQDLWHHPADQEYFMDYGISYIYPEEERLSGVEIESFPLRLMTRDEIMNIIEQAQKESGVKIKPLKFFDRSILIGRHMDTDDYNKNCHPMRGAVNSLFEGYVRTDLDSLLIDYVPRQGFDHLNAFFESFFMSCNVLVNYTISILSGYDMERNKLNSDQEMQPFYPDPLKKAMQGMRRVIEGMGWASWGDVRANVIEPQLGYSLRQLEMELQTGMGFGHGLVGIFEIRK